MLEYLGCRVDVAENGRVAVERLHRGSYDVVLMDNQMPVMNGLEAARRICRDLPAERRPMLVAGMALAASTACSRA